MSDISFEFYKAFYYVALYGNISKAAAQLFTSQPALSKTIHKLESQVGCALFTRTVRGVTLTAEGKMLYEHVRKACEAIFGAEKELELHRTLQSGVVRINTNGLLTKTVLIPVIKDFRKQYDNIFFELYSLNYGSARHGLASGSLDFGVDYEDRLYQDRNITRKEGQRIKLWRGRVFYDAPYCSPTYKHLQGRRLSTSDIAAAPLVLKPQLQDSDMDFYTETFRPNGANGKDIFASGIETRISLLVEGMGIGFIPTQMGDQYVEQEKLIRLEYDGYLPARRFTLFTDADSFQSIAAKRFFEFLAEKESLSEECIIE